MKKILKRLLAGAAAIAMAVSCMSVTAFAETPTPVSSVDFTVSYSSMSGSAAPATFQYDITLESIAREGSGVTMSNAPVPTLDREETSFDGAGTQTITVSLPTYDNVGIYTYSIKQTYTGSSSAVKADDTTLYLVVTAAYDSSNMLQTYATLHKDSATGTKVTNGEGFDNSYASGSLMVTKEVRGAMGDRKRQYAISVSFDSTEDLSSVISASKMGGNENVSISGNSVSFTLADGETIGITNIPTGVNYSVTETDTGSFTTDYTNSPGTISDNPSYCTVVNDFGNATVDTGINLDNLPYILILTGVAVAGVVFAVMRKKHDEEA